MAQTFLLAEYLYRLLVADAFLVKPKNRAIAEALERNLSLRQIARETGASVTTIRKVKAIVDRSEIDDFQ